MVRMFFAVALMAAASVSQADIYKCVTDGRVTYQSRVCPGHADVAEDVSHLERSSGSSYVPNQKEYEQRYSERAYKDARADRSESLEDRKRQRLLRDIEYKRQQNLYRQKAAQREAERARRDRLRKEERDSDDWRREQDRRKARRNNDYFMIDVIRR